MELSKRLISLDILRGLTIAGMIVVNDPGSWDYVYPPLRHAPWHGITPTDFVFPFFLFIVGISVVLAFTRRRQEDADSHQLMNKTIIRSLMIFGFGLFLAVSSTTLGFKLAQLLVGVLLLYGLTEIQQPLEKGGTRQKKLVLGGVMLAAVVLFIALNPSFSLPNFRLPGVLQRIAVVFLICAFLFLRTTWKTQAIIGSLLLVGYWLLMTLVPVPIDPVVEAALASGEVLRSSGMVSVEGIEALSGSYIAGNLEPGVNLQAWLDRVFIPGRIYEKTWDPEGLLSTLPAIGSGIAGMLAGHMILNEDGKEKKANNLFIYGFCLFVAGSVWNWFFPFNKNLWSSSFVLYTAGLSTLTFAALYWFVDLKKKGNSNPLFFVGKVFGANAITAYVLHGLFARLSFPVRDGFMSSMLNTGIAGEFASLLWATVYTLFIFAIAYVMYRRRLFLKL
ncbi:MAG: DUF1624 domain-containing protein [Rhodothermaceae bacterium]|nr:DUF1624 domain-containing protein [Rhodothermaceae bacterium]